MHRRHLPISSPCSADWDAMEGTRAARHCASCDKRVYNLSALTEREARAALATMPAQACIRYTARASGEVVFAAVVALGALSGCAPAEPVALRQQAPVVLEAPQAVAQVEPVEPIVPVEIPEAEQVAPAAAEPPSKKLEKRERRRTFMGGRRPSEEERPIMGLMLPVDDF